MPGPKKDASGGGSGGRTQNGNRSSFQTDSAISKDRFGGERMLQRWVPDSNDGIDGSLEKSTNKGTWDQFAENERLFGLKTDYDENIYTTAINKNHPQYRERIAAAEKKAREIERSAASTAHVAEERVMDYVAGNDKSGENEEDKYSGVRRQDFPPLGNKYTPPAKRAPAAHSTVKGAPVDPAIISSQIKGSAKKQATQPPDAVKNGIAPKPEAARPAQAKPAEANAVEQKQVAPDTTTETKSAETTSTPSRSSVGNSRTISPQVKESTPSATSTVERDVLKEFKTFASQQRENAQKVRSNKAKADKEIKLTELKKFANSFKLSTPVPTDLVSIIAKDPAKQKEIQAKAIKNAEEVAKAKVDIPVKDKSATTQPATTQSAKEASQPAKSTEPTTSKAVTETRPSRTANSHPIPSQAGSNRQPGHRQQYPQQQYQYRNNRGGPAQQQTGNLSQRLRMVEQQKYSNTSNSHQHPVGPDGRAPPTGPANNVDPNFGRRLSGVPSHVGGGGNKLNPNSHEFRPGSFASSLNPNGHPSASSSPRSAVTNVPEAPAATPPASGAGQLIRRKTKAVDVNKCYILSHIKTITPPQGRNWDDNGGLRPSFDTLPTWRQLQDDEKADSTMHLTYKEHFEQRQPFSNSTMATPNPPHALPHMAHQHQLPFHLQQGGQHMGQRQSPHLAHMQMHTPQHGPGGHPPYGHDDHRMVHSNSAQSFASPRPGQVAMAYPGVNSPGQVPYNQHVYMGPGTPQMGQFRSFSNNPQYMSPQQAQMGGPMMMQPHFMPGPQGMVGGPQILYPGAHPPFIPPGGPPQPVLGTNGFPSSPGRPQAPMMAHQGSQQGQPMYGMSPGVQYSQPSYGHGQPGGPMPNQRGYNNAGGSQQQQHYGSSPQQAHQFGPHHQQRSGSNGGYNNKNYVAHGQHQQGHPATQAPAQSGPNRVAEGADEAK